MLRAIGFVLLLHGICFEAHNPAFGQSNQPIQDSIVFTNGDSLTGVISGATASNVRFSNDALGPLAIKWSTLRSVLLSQRATIVADASGGSDQTFEKAELTVVTSGSKLALEVKTANNPQGELINNVSSVSLNVPAPAANKPCGSDAATPCPGWLLTKFAVNTALLAATQHQQTYGAELDLLRGWNAQATGWPHQRTLVQLIPNYNDTRKNSKVGSATVTQEYEGSIQHLMFFSSDNFYGTLLADEYRNNSLGLYFQQSYGAGLGGIVHDVELNADFRFIGQHFYAPYKSAGLVGAELSERYVVPLDFLRAGASLTETGIVVPVFNTSRAWQARGRVDLTIPLSKTVQFTTTSANYYVENTPDAYHKNYFKNTVAIQYTPTPTK